MIRKKLTEVGPLGETGLNLITDDDGATVGYTLFDSQLLFVVCYFVVFCRFACCFLRRFKPHVTLLVSSLFNSSYGFAEYETPDFATRAVRQLNNLKLDKQHVPFVANRIFFDFFFFLIFNFFFFNKNIFWIESTSIADAFVQFVF